MASPVVPRLTPALFMAVVLRQKLELFQQIIAISTVAGGSPVRHVRVGVFPIAPVELRELPTYGSESLGDDRHANGVNVAPRRTSVAVRQRQFTERRTALGLAHPTVDQHGKRLPSAPEIEPAAVRE